MPSPIPSSPPPPTTTAIETAENREEVNCVRHNNNDISNIVEQTFWNSPEAKCWFGRGEKDEIVEETVRQTIKRFKHAYMKYDGWKEIVSDNDQKEVCTNHDIFLIRSKAMYLAISLQLALDHMPTKTWGVCCDEAVAHVQKFHQLLGSDEVTAMATKYGGTIQRWFRLWKANHHCFPNPYYVRNGKDPLPQLLDNYPNFRKSLIKKWKKIYLNYPVNLC